MTPELWMRNIAAFAGQATVLIVAGAAMWRVMGVHRPVATFAYWRGLLLACLLLPLLQPWQVSTALPIDEPSSSASLTSEGPLASGTGAAINATSTADAIGGLLVMFLAAGVALRTIWLVLGACRLHRLARSAVPLTPLPEVILDAQTRTGVSAIVCVSDAAAGPITFGFRRPMVILPPSVLMMGLDLQTAVVSHELVHVRRRDWLQMVVEEAVRTVFWFHPAIWWLINRIQLSREHVVDEAVIHLTQSRGQYVEALLTVASWRTPGTLVPAPLFLRRRFLKKRIAHILQEASMSTRRVIASIGASIGVLAAVAVFAVRAFPIEARRAAITLEPPSRSSAQAEPVQIVSGGTHLLHGTLPEYPRRAIEERVAGDVSLNVTIDDRGEVSDASVISGPPELRRAALESVLQWHYSPEAMRSTSTQVVLRFQVPAADADRLVARVEEERAVAVNSVEARERAAALEALMQSYEVQQKEYGAALLRREKARQAGLATQDETLVLRQKLIETERGLHELRVIAAKVQERAAPPILRQIELERLGQETADAILSLAQISVGDQMTEAALRRLREATQSVDPHLRVAFNPRTGNLRFIAP
jgi:TonB family protein